MRIEINKLSSIQCPLPTNSQRVKITFCLIVPIKNNRSVENERSKYSMGSFSGTHNLMTVDGLKIAGIRGILRPELGN